MNTFKAGDFVHPLVVALDVDLGMFWLLTDDATTAHHSTLSSLRGVMAFSVDVVESVEYES